MLENDFTNGQYVYEAGSDYTEVVLVSLGQYIYDGIENNFDQISQAGSGEGENNKMAGLTRLEVEATKNGESIQDLLHVRNVNANGNNFFDFMCIIPQDEGNEGFYQFTFKYSIGGESYESKFQFYIIFRKRLILLMI